MKKAYIILAHQKPEQLARLVASLEGGRSHFFIHLDCSCVRAPFERALADRGQWQFVRGENGGWGQFGIVKGTLHGLHAVAAHGEKFDFVHLISGMDYPLRSNAYMDRFFEHNRGKIFMEWWPFPASHWSMSDFGFDRIYKYHVGGRKSPQAQRISRLISKLANATPVFRRRFPRGLTPFGGWQWWSIPVDVVHVILEFVARRPDFVRYHYWSLLPDEMFFQTILLNHDHGALRSRIVNNCLRFLDWDNPNPLGPALLSKRYFSPLVDSGSLFARKFDQAYDAEILDLIDSYRIEEERKINGLTDSEGGAFDFAYGDDFPNSPASPQTKRNLFS
jgi:hypothetical protein